MFANNLLIRGGTVQSGANPAGGDQAECEFVLIKNDGTDTTRICKGSSLVEPLYLNVKHSTTGKGLQQVDRHLIQFSKTESAGVGSQNTASINLTINVPRAGTFNEGEVMAMIRYLTHFLGIEEGVELQQPAMFTGRVRSILIGEA